MDPARIITTLTLVLALLLLWPLLLFQGRRVRARTPVLAEPAGAREGGTGRAPGIRLLVLGDSAAAGVGANDQTEALTGQILANLTADEVTYWALHARTGLTTRGAIELVDQLPRAQYDMALVMLGVNDVTSPITSNRWLAQQRKLWALLRTRFQVRHLLVCNLPPMGQFPALPQPLRWFLGARAALFASRLQAELAGRNDTSLLAFEFDANPDDMAEDGFHPGPPLYRAMGQAIGRAITQQTQVQRTPRQNQQLEPTQEAS